MRPHSPAPHHQRNVALPLLSIASQLGRNQLSVQPAARQQLVVRSLLDDLALVEDENGIGVTYRRKPVRDDDRRPARPSIDSEHLELLPH